MNRYKTQNTVVFKKFAQSVANLLVIMLGLMVLFTLFAIPMSLAQSLPVPVARSGDDWLVGIVAALFTAAKSGQWLLVLSIAIAILTRVVQVIVEKVKPSWLPTEALPWISFVLASASYIVASLIEGKGLGQALVLGVITGATASGLWSLVIKYLPLVGKTEEKTR